MVIEIDRYWSDHPPLHLMVAAYLDIKPQSSAIEASAAELHDLPQEIAANTVSASEFDALLKARGFT